MNFEKHIQSYNYHHNKDIEHFSHPKEFSHHPAINCNQSPASNISLWQF